MKYRALFRTVLDDGYLEQKVRESIAGTGIRFEPEFNKYQWLMNVIARAYDKNMGKQPEGGVTIRSKVNPDEGRRNPAIKIGTLEHLFGGQRKHINRYLDNLVEWKVVSLHTPHVSMVKAATWVFTHKYEKYPRSYQWFSGGKNSTIQKVIQMWMTKLQEPLVQATQDTYDHHIEMSEEGIQYVRDLLKHPNIDIIADALLGGYYDDNKEDLSELLKGVPVPPRETGLIAFFMKDAYCNRLAYGKRMYGTFQLLPKEYRKFVLMDRKPMIEIDLVSSQPLFASVLLKKTWRQLHGNKPYPADLELFQETCLKNIFYEVIAAGAGVELTNELRNDFKRDFFRECFYSRDYETKRKVKPIKEAFKRLYPDTFQLINHIKGPNYTRFAVMCQDMEAELMIYTVYKQLLAEGICCLPLHDALYVSTPEAEKRAKELITEAFQQKHGITIRFKTEDTKALAEQEFVIFKQQRKI